MSQFKASESLLNSKIFARSENTEDREWMSGERTSRAAKQKTRYRTLFMRKYQKSPDKKKSWLRRRRLGSKSIALPSEICDLFTEGERAALNIIANVIKEKGICNWPIDKIAAIAGVCRRTVQNAMKAAQEVGLLNVQQRPVRGRKNLPNVIRIINDRWLSWLKKMKSTFYLAIGCKTLHPTGEYSNNISNSQLEYTSDDLLMKGKIPDD